MVEIAPLKGLFYNSNKFRDISKKLAPPYDIISEKQRSGFFKQDPFNIVNLTLPKDTGKISKYKNSKKILDQWIDRKILITDENKYLYVFEEEFSKNNKKKRFLGFIGLLNFNEYKEGKVLRHEKTLSRPKEDRLNLLKSTRTNFEFIYTIYNDPDGSILKILNSFTKNTPFISTPVEYDPSLYFKLWRINKGSSLKKIIDSMKNKNILIADGHHRYETSLLYKKYIKNQEIKTSPENYILTLFVPGNQKDLMIYPTHRIVRFSNNIDPLDIIKKISRFFLIKKIKNPHYLEINNKMKTAAANNKKTLCLYFNNNNCYFITLRYRLINIYKKIDRDLEDYNEDFEYLDVNILHRLILGSLLKNYKIQDISFFHKTSEVLSCIDEINHKKKSSGLNCAGFILNPPSISLIEKLSNERKIMPQKSTYFYPKPCSGLLMYKFDY